MLALGFIVQICSGKPHINSGHYAIRPQILSEHLETIKSAGCMHKFAYEIKEVLNPSGYFVNIMLPFFKKEIRVTAASLPVTFFF